MKKAIILIIFCLPLLAACGGLSGKPADEVPVVAKPVSIFEEVREVEVGDVVPAEVELVIPPAMPGGAGQMEEVEVQASDLPVMTEQIDEEGEEVGDLRMDEESECNSLATSVMVARCKEYFEALSEPGLLPEVREANLDEPVFDPSEEPAEGAEALPAQEV